MAIPLKTVQNYSKYVIECYRIYSYKRYILLNIPMLLTLHTTISDEAIDGKSKRNDKTGVINILPFLKRNSPGSCPGAIG